MRVRGERVTEKRKESERRGERSESGIFYRVLLMTSCTS